MYLSACGMILVEFFCSRKHEKALKVFLPLFSYFPRAEKEILYLEEMPLDHARRPPPMPRESYALRNVHSI